MSAEDPTVRSRGGAATHRRRRGALGEHVAEVVRVGRPCSTARHLDAADRLAEGHVRGGRACACAAPRSSPCQLSRRAAHADSATPAQRRSALSSSVGGGNVGGGSGAGGGAPTSLSALGRTKGHHAERPHQPRTPPRDFSAVLAAPAPPPQWANCSSGGTPSHFCALTSPEIVVADTSFCAEPTNHLGSGPMGSIEPLNRMSVWPPGSASKCHFAP